MSDDTIKDIDVSLGNGTVAYRNNHLPSTHDGEDVSADEKLIIALRENGLDESMIAMGLKDILSNAVLMNSKGDTVEAFEVKLKALNTLCRLLTKKPEVQINIANIYTGNNSF